MILQIVGFKNSGKTTLMQHTIQFLKSYGYTIVTIKHHGHIGDDITLQEDHVDHMKHFNAGADQSIVQGEHYQQTVTRAYKQNLTQMIDQSVTIDCNIILVEGFKDEHFDKVVVYQTTEELEQLKQLIGVKYCYYVHDKHALSQYDYWLLQWIEQRD
ncbi:molybdopterin-guanine dinucleotide biosynthesis protein B [Staphylococcus haemolyticus]|uniref:molybdopterin-guanine dinucleotide biosynthesis protein B n=1 Tax=Staphylococcus haemolyticus TaxID=1283 RepID=UPI000CBE30CA|nr:molybdopterin-guanine dinucleotide biosynthesis protein B [Staphylococcus haemolyticus]ECO1693684.1 molybdopterin-guanine dinucleotide biosynthesis protein B [Listeria monocytogenes]MBY6178760.1 molybdopterin-guanine dinucleotide biosynthesis protein B [Staphylococcaceae bacterium DP2N0-1]MCE0455552.1 molybdopterin-guanine dinucleotide biosynthesis protein B [Staphylococcus haemolyticus]MCH4476242.1 molybdopterin-guanine dinucleotide biosynthesis protein B [Staphylococcus haemolyticus]MEB26